MKVRDWFWSACGFDKLMKFLRAGGSKIQICLSILPATEIYSVLRRFKTKFKQNYSGWSTVCSILMTLGIILFYLFSVLQWSSTELTRSVYSTILFPFKLLQVWKNEIYLIKILSKGRALIKLPAIHFLR